MVWDVSAIRAIQILVVVSLAAAVIFVLLRLSLIALPVLLALIISSALWPLVRLLRKVMSSLLAAWSVFLGSLLVLGRNRHRAGVLGAGRMAHLGRQGS